MTRKQAEARVVRQAVRLLREDAQCTYDSCKGTDAPWVCGGSSCPNCNARKSYRARVKVANQLECALARKEKK